MNEPHKALPSALLSSGYGADEHGLICGYRFRAQGPAEHLGIGRGTLPAWTEAAAPQALAA